MCLPLWRLALTPALIILGIVAALFGGESASAAETEKELREEVMFNFNRFADWRDAIRKKYLVYGVGELTRESRGEFEYRNYLRGFRVQQNKPPFDYSAFCRVMEQKTGRIDDAEWHEIVRRPKGLLRRLRTDPRPDNYVGKEIPREHDGSGLRRDPTPFDPLEYIYGYAVSVASPEALRNSMEVQFFRRSRLISVERLSNGDLRSKFVNRKNSNSITEVIQSGKFDGMPTRVRTMTNNPGMSGPSFSEVSTDWEFQSKGLLPLRISSAFGREGGSNSVVQVVFKLQWFIGDDVPDSMFAPDAADYRTRLEDFFDLKFSLGGPNRTIIPGDPITLPNDLYMDKPDKK